MTDHIIAPWFMQQHVIFYPKHQESSDPYSQNVTLDTFCITCLQTIVLFKNKCIQVRAFVSNLWEMLVYDLLFTLSVSQENRQGRHGLIIGVTL